MPVEQNVFKWRICVSTYFCFSKQPNAYNDYIFVFSKIFVRFSEHLCNRLCAKHGQLLCQMKLRERSHWKFQFGYKKMQFWEHQASIPQQTPFSRLEFRNHEETFKFQVLSQLEQQFNSKHPNVKFASKTASIQNS